MARPGRVSSLDYISQLLDSATPPAIGKVLTVLAPGYADFATPGGGGLTGTLTPGFLPVASAPTVLADSAIFQDPNANLSFWGGASTAFATAEQAVFLANAIAAPDATVGATGGLIVWVDSATQSLNLMGALDLSGPSSPTMQLYLGERIGLAALNVPQPFGGVTPYIPVLFANSNFGVNIQIGDPAALQVDRINFGAGTSYTFAFSDGGNLAYTFNGGAPTLVATAATPADLGNTFNPWGNLFCMGQIMQTAADGSAAGVATFTNAPHAGNPDGWVPYTFNGVAGWIPWQHA